MKSMTQTVVFLASLVAAASFALAAPKDITTRTNPDGSLNIEARYLVHVGFSAYNAGLSSAVSAASRGLVEYHSSGGNSGNWGRVNNGLTVFANPVVDPTTQENFTPNTFGGPNPDYAGYLFNCPAKNITAVRFWNRVYVDGGTFAATPELQYLDGPEPLGTWHTISAVTWSTAYDTTFADTVRPYEIAVNQPLAGVWGIRLIGDGNPAGAVAADPTGWVGFQELAVVGELDIGDIDLHKNKALTGSPIATAEHAGVLSSINDGVFTASMDTWGPWAGEDYLGITWSTPQNRIAAMGVCFRMFGDGGIFDDCQDPLRIEYTTLTNSTWTPVTGLKKYRYPYVWQRVTYLGAAELGFLFTFDEVTGVTGLRIIGDPEGISNDRDGFLGTYEVEVFGVPVMGEIVNYDASADGDVDATDLGLFLNCWSGPTVPYSTTPTNCSNRDLDKDGDVDESDFAVFQRCFSGPGVAADPFCG